MAVVIESSLKEIHGYSSSVYGKDNILTTVAQAAAYSMVTRRQVSLLLMPKHSKLVSGTYLRYPTGIVENPYRNFQAGDVHFVDQNGDGWINEADKVVIGDPNPRYLW